MAQRGSHQFTHIFNTPKKKRSISTWIFNAEYIQEEQHDLGGTDQNMLKLEFRCLFTLVLSEVFPFQTSCDETLSREQIMQL